MIYMYENNYNYIDVPEEGKEKKTDNKVGKTVAMLLAVAIVGGASGFGGAYLQNSIAVKDEPAAPVSAENTQTPAVTESSSKLDTKPTIFFR